MRYILLSGFFSASSNILGTAALVLLWRYLYVEVSILYLSFDSSHIDENLDHQLEWLW